MTFCLSLWIASWRARSPALSWETQRQVEKVKQLLGDEVRESNEDQKGLSTKTETKTGFKYKFENRTETLTKTGPNPIIDTSTDHRDSKLSIVYIFR